MAQARLPRIYPRAPARWPLGRRRTRGAGGPPHGSPHFPGPVYVSRGPCFYRTVRKRLREVLVNSDVFCFVLDLPCLGRTPPALVPLACGTPGSGSVYGVLTTTLAPDVLDRLHVWGGGGGGGSPGKTKGAVPVQGGWGLRLWLPSGGCLQ
jgi:hypothetical protein